MRPACPAVRCPYSRASAASVSANVDSQTTMSARSASANAASHSRVSMMNANRWPGLGSLTCSTVTSRPSRARRPRRCRRPTSGPAMPSAASFSGSIRRPSGSVRRYPTVGTLCDSFLASRRELRCPGHRPVAVDRPLAQADRLAEQGRVPQPGEDLPVVRRVAGLHDVADPVQGHPLQHARQAQAVITVEVGDADAGDLARRDPGEQHLPLGSLARVEQQALAVPAQQVAVVAAAARGRLARRAKDHKLARGHGIRPYAEGADAVSPRISPARTSRA